MSLLFIPIFIFIFSFLIIVHEFGHFYAARKSGVKVEEFGLGIGPKIYGKKFGETEYTLNLIPFGGFVRMLGEEESSKNPRSFEQAKLWKRMVITLAGVFVNYIIALLLLTILFTIGTNPIFVNRDDISKALKNETISLEKIPNSPRAKIIYKEQIKKDFPASLFFAATETFRISKALVVKVSDIPGDLIRKQALPEGMMGPVGIAYVVKEVIPQGLNSVVKLVAMLSLSLAVMNLLPIPALDGGRFFMQIIEMIIRRPIPQKLEGLVNMSGFFLLLGLLVLVTWNDIVSWIAR